MIKNSQISIVQIEESMNYWKTINKISEAATRKEFQLGKEVHVFFAPLIPNVELYNELSLEEKKRASRFKNLLDQQRYIISHGILRHILSAYVFCAPHDIEFKKLKYGKPVLSSQNVIRQVQFNMSHSKDIACYIVSRNFEVGIDIEFTEAEFDWFNTANYSFTPYEVTNLKNLSKDQQAREFFSLWTKKEALLKAKGTGLSEVEKSCGKLPAIHKGKYQVHSFDCKEGYQGAVAIKDQDASICYYRMPCLDNL